MYCSKTGEILRGELREIFRTEGNGGSEASEDSNLRCGHNFVLLVAFF
jgi:hypothetical protein